ncbi:MAG: flagellar hook-basal body protein [Myxococcota bacterium]
MPTGLYISYSGAVAAQAQLEVIANNVANASTSGFRRDQTIFDTVLGAAMPFSRAAGGQIDLAPGTHQLTKNPLHAAIDGEGFFVVQDASGRELYTRRGDFRLNANRELVLPNGLAVQGTGGQLAIPSGSVASFRDDGTLMTELGPIGKLRIVTFNDPSGLRKRGGSLIEADPSAAPRDLDRAKIGVGFVEASNVNLAGEMVALIQATRSFEASLQSLRLGDEMTQSLIQAQL